MIDNLYMNLHLTKRLILYIACQKKDRLMIKSLTHSYKETQKSSSKALMISKFNKYARERL